MKNNKFSTSRCFLSIYRSGHWDNRGFNVMATSIIFSEHYNRSGSFTNVGHVFFSLF